MSVTSSAHPAGLKRALGLQDLIFYGIVLIQPTAPLPLFGIVSKEARGHVVTTILIAMIAMLFTAMSYGRMARAYPAAGSAYTYVGRELHPALGYVTGWGMALDYMVNPILCTVWCSKAALNILPAVPYAGWVIFFASLFTSLNLRGIQASARTNRILTFALGSVVLVFFAAAIRYLLAGPALAAAELGRPFYNPEAFAPGPVLTGTSIAALTYIGFDGISTLSEEVHNPRRNVLLATVLTCLITGVLASAEVYVAQLVWPTYHDFPDVDTAFVHVAGRAGGVALLQLVNFSLVVATIGSGTGAQLGAARLLYSMGRDNAIPRRFFGVVEPKRSIPQNNVLFLGALTLAGAFVMSFQLAAELLNFGAFIAFMGVNLAALTHYYVRSARKQLRYLAPPVLGFVTCFFIWWGLGSTAKLAGGIWLAFGILYGAIRMKRLDLRLQTSEIPEE